jgi:hypothetical protein
VLERFGLEFAAHWLDWGWSGAPVSAVVSEVFVSAVVPEAASALAGSGPLCSSLCDCGPKAPLHILELQCTRPSGSKLDQQQHHTIYILIECSETFNECKNTIIILRKQTTILKLTSLSVSQSPKKIREKIKVLESKKQK